MSLAQVVDHRAALGPRRRRPRQVPRPFPAGVEASAAHGNAASMVFAQARVAVDRRARPGRCTATAGARREARKAVDHHQGLRHRLAAKAARTATASKARRRSAHSPADRQDTARAVSRRACSRRLEDIDAAGNSTARRLTARPAAADRPAATGRAAARRATEATGAAGNDAARHLTARPAAADRPAATGRAAAGRASRGSSGNRRRGHGAARRAPETDRPPAADAGPDRAGAAGHRSRGTVGACHATARRKAGDTRPAGTAAAGRRTHYSVGAAVARRAGRGAAAIACSCGCDAADDARGRAAAARRRPSAAGSAAAGDGRSGAPAATRAHGRRPAGDRGAGAPHHRARRQHHHHPLRRQRALPALGRAALRAARPRALRLHHPTGRLSGHQRDRCRRPPAAPRATRPGRTRDHSDRQSQEAGLRRRAGRRSRRRCDPRTGGAGDHHPARALHRRHQRRSRAAALRDAGGAAAGRDRAALLARRGPLQRGAARPHAADRHQLHHLRFRLVGGRAGAAGASSRRWRKRSGACWRSTRTRCS